MAKTGQNSEKSLLDMMGDFARSPFGQILSMRYPQIGEMFGQFATNPLVTYGASEQAAGEEQEAWDEYEQASEGDIERALGLAGERPRKAMDLYGRRMGQAILQYRKGKDKAEGVLEALPGQIGEFGEGFLSDFSGMTEDILEGYGDRYRFAEEELEGYGESGRADISRAFDEEWAEIEYDLAQRGVSPSDSAYTSARLAATESQSAELRRLEDDLIRNRLDTLTGLSGETLGAQTSLGLAESGFEAALKGDEFAANQLLAQFYQSSGAAMSGLFERKAAGLTNIYTSTTGDQLAAMQGITRVPPPESDLPYQLGYGSPQAAQAPSSSAGWVSGGLQAGGDIAAAAILASAMSSRTYKNVYGAAAPVLDRIEATPVHRWAYKESIDPVQSEHIGPMAEDFCREFDVGTEKEIDVISMLGILFKGIQELRQELRDLRSE